MMMFQLWLGHWELYLICLRNTQESLIKSYHKTWSEKAALLRTTGILEKCWQYIIRDSNVRTPLGPLGSQLAPKGDLPGNVNLLSLRFHNKITIMIYWTFSKVNVWKLKLVSLSRSFFQHDCLLARRFFDHKNSLLWENVCSCLHYR